MLAPYFPDADEAFLAGWSTGSASSTPTIAVPPTQAFPGAHEALAAVRRHRGSTLVITGKYEPNARLHTDALGFDVDRIVGSVWGPGKGPVLAEHGASIYVGDHVHDVEGALAAGVHSVSVLTGGCDEDELRRRRHAHGAPGPDRRSRVARGAHARPVASTRSDAAAVSP